MLPVIKIFRQNLNNKRHEREALKYMVETVDLKRNQRTSKQST